MGKGYKTMVGEGRLTVSGRLGEDIGYRRVVGDGRQEVWGGGKRRDIVDEG